MHTVQLMLIEDDNPEATLDSVKRYVEGRLDDFLDGSGGASWCDWYEVGGRWSGHYIEGDALRYSDDPEKFQALVDEFLKSRTTEFHQWLDEYADEATAGNYDNLRDADVTGREGWSYNRKQTLLMNALKAVNDYWTQDSKLFDLTNHTTFIRNFNERVAERPEQQYLVVVDFHF